MPIAIRPVIDTCRITLNRLIDDRNRGSMIANSSISASRKISRREAREEARTASKLRASDARRARRICAIDLLLSRACRRRLVERHHRHQRSPASPSARAISPVMRPSRIVTMRSLIASTSGSSDEIDQHRDARFAPFRRGSRAPRSWRRRRCRASVRRRSGSSASAPASGRARPSADCRRRVWRPSAPGSVMRMLSLRLNEFDRAHSRLRSSMNHPQRRNLRHARRCERLVADRQLQEQRLLLAVLGHEADARPDRRLRRIGCRRACRRSKSRRSRADRRRTSRARSRCGRRRRARRSRGFRRWRTSARRRSARWRAGRADRGGASGPRRLSAIAGPGVGAGRAP